MLLGSRTGLHVPPFHLNREPLWSPYFLSERRQFCKLRICHWAWGQSPGMPGDPVHVLLRCRECDSKKQTPKARCVGLGE